MIRSLALAGILSLCLVLGGVPAYAATCSPACGSGNVCVDSSTGPTCEPVCVRDGNCTLDEIVVTAPSRGGMTFADIVNDRIVPFVDGAVIPLLYVLAFLFFVIGVARYFFTGGEENRQKGKAFVLWGLIGMVAIFGVWGVVHLLLSAIPGA